METDAAQKSARSPSPGGSASGPARARPSAREAARRSAGAVYTRPWAARMVLDLAGYEPGRDLAAVRVVEPSCGDGVFVRELVGRLADSCALNGRPLGDAVDALRAVDLDPVAVARTRASVRDVLAARGAGPDEADGLARSWVREADFLLDPVPRGDVDLVVGNPPYVRLEDVPAGRMAAYRSAWPCMTGRSDLYVGFMEAALRSLRPGGSVAFLCADRWMRNAYGARVRSLIEQEFSVDAYVCLHRVDVFRERVAAYPAVTLVRRGRQGTAATVRARPDLEERDAPALVAAARVAAPALVAHPRFDASLSPGWFRGGAAWPSNTPGRLAVLADLERRFPPLEHDGTRIGIGVTTGADRVFLPDAPPPIEQDRLLPVVGCADTATGVLAWSGRFLANPWGDDGKLLALGAHPLLAAYLASHGQALRARYVARKHPDRWWRTIDRVDPALAARPKLLLPDLKDSVHPVLDRGGHYPAHNLTHVTSGTWDLRVLGGLLLSDVGGLFVESYSVRMASGCLRTTPQYLRTVRVPEPRLLDPGLGRALRAAFGARDRPAATEAALAAYGLGPRALRGA